jgi:hypothetical protein
MPLFHDRRDGSIKKVPADVVDAYGYASGKDYQDLHEGFISHHMEGYDLMSSDMGAPGPERGDKVYSDGNVDRNWSNEDYDGPTDKEIKKNKKERNKVKKNLKPFPSSNDDWGW